MALVDSLASRVSNFSRSAFMKAVLETSLTSPSAFASAALVPVSACRRSDSISWSSVVSSSSSLSPCEKNMSASEPALLEDVPWPLLSAATSLKILCAVWLDQRRTDATS
ncbi:hypothetical protein D3C87_1741170 [compost metagenome]